MHCPKMRQVYAESTGIDPASLPSKFPATAIVRCAAGGAGGIRWNSYRSFRVCWMRYVSVNSLLKNDCLL